MNIITYNVRGLGKGVKWPAIRRMVNTQHIDMLCIQETKKLPGVKNVTGKCFSYA